MRYIILSMLFIFTTLVADEYSDWLNSQNSQFNNYKKTIDDEFQDMLKKDWKAFQTQNNRSSFVKPKPRIIPRVKKEIVLPKKELKISKKVKAPKIVKQIIKEPEVVIDKDILKDGYSDIRFDFYGQDISIQYDEKYNFELDSIDKNSISDVWKNLSKADFKTLDKQIVQYSKLYNLNDWAKYLLIYNIGQNIYHDKNKVNLFTWYILVKMGYDTKVGYNSHKIYLMSKVKENLYQVSFFTLEGAKYYILTPKGRVSSVGAIYTYASNYPNATKALDFDMNNKAIKIYTNKMIKELEFEYLSKNYKVKVAYSKDLINFYKTFPQSQYNLYFNAKKSPLIANTLLAQLKPLISDKSEIEAVNLLLRFVQKSFRYKTDEEQFHYEKVLFPEETVYYPYSDCEDRSIIFAYLVKKLLGLDVVGLKYSDHLASAVHFSTPVDGDSFVFDGKRYTVSDPTYINANVGMTMPQYKNSQFKIIK